MKNLVLTGAREKFLKARELCPVIKSEGVYLVTDYIGIRIGDEITVMDLIKEVMDVIVHLVFLDKNSDSQNEYERIKLFKIKVFYPEVRKGIALIPRVIDFIADPEFALEFRKVWEYAKIGNIFGKSPLCDVVSTDINNTIRDDRPYSILDDTYKNDLYDKNLYKNDLGENDLGDLFGDDSGLKL